MRNVKIVYDPGFLEKLKKVNVRIRKKVKDQTLLFSEDPNNLQLNNHPLKKEFQGYRSINVTSDWRVIYKETKISGEIVAYFIILGTHRELYGN